MTQKPTISKTEKVRTAVEYLAEKYNYITWLRNRDEISPETAEHYKKKYLEQAKQMEKEQIEKAWDDGFDTGYLSPNNANKYYNETYGK